MLRLSKKLSKKTYILSAKYGVLELSDVIDPYDLTLSNFSKNEKRDWKKMVLEKAKKKKISFENCAFLTGKNYSLGIDGFYPLDGFKGMGYKIKEANRILNSNRKRLF